MAFLIYKKSPDGAAVRYEKIKTIKLAGANGLIAQHVKTLRGNDAAKWKLEAAELLDLYGLPPNGDELAVLFDVTAPDAMNVCLYELLRIHGSSADYSTQLALDFSVVIDQLVDVETPEFAKDFKVILPIPPKLLGETLSLTGGANGGDWKWGGSAMQIGATVVQAAVPVQSHGHGHGHGTGEPCPSCTCGRREAVK
jgi:hypothetical protein